MKFVPGFENLYSVTTDGRVWSHRRNKWLTLVKHHTGYLMVGFSVNGKVKNMYVHKSVSNTYLGKSKLTVNHKNGIKTDNRVDNLELCTTKENNRHAIKLGLVNYAKGEQCHNTFFNEKDVIQIRTMFFTDKSPQYKIAEKYKASKSNIHRILTRQIWSHVKDGFPAHKAILGRNQINNV